MRVTKRAIRKYYGEIHHVAPSEGGAFANCRFCQWGQFYPDRERKHWNAVDRAHAALRSHIRKVHADKLPQFAEF